MNNYIVSARKYRPSTFRSVIGQHALTTTLKNAIASNKLAHAYLFCGPRGVGKTTCARIFGKTINCFSPTSDGEACNECESCLAFNEHRSFNIHELDAASNNSVDDIRSLIDQVRIPPQIGQYKVYIIDEVHMLSSAAFNAFLKTLEEPPHHAIFILATTEKHKILPTILSRCQIYDFSRIKIGDIVAHLQYVADQENVKVESEALNILAQKADGGMRDALSIFDQVVSFTAGDVTYKAVIDNLNVLDYEYYFKLTAAVLQGNVVDSLLILNDISNKGFDGHNVITGIASHFRDLLLCKDPQTASLLEVGESIRNRYIEMAKACDNKLLYRAIDLLNECDLNYRQSRNKRLLSDLTLIKLCQLVVVDDAAAEKKKDLISPITPVAKVNLPSSNQAAVSPAPAPATVQANPVAPQTTPVDAVPQKEEEKKPKSQPFSNLGISISAITNSNQLQEQKTPTKSVVEQSEPFTSDQLVSEWKAYAELLEDNQHLKHDMIHCLPSLISDVDFEVVVNNQLQEERLTNASYPILSFLRDKLKNTQIKLVLRLIMEEETGDKKAKFGTIQEKFNLMADENSSLLKLKDEFDLELD